MSWSAHASCADGGGAPTRGSADVISEPMPFAAVLAAASPGPWRVVAAGDGGRFRVEAGSCVVESDLARPHADYLVALRGIADELSAMVDDPGRRDARRARQLAKDYAAKARSVAPEWLFVAPCEGVEAWFMHNSSAMIGAARLRVTDAALIDAGRLAIPRLLMRLGVATRPTPEHSAAARPPIVVPGRAPDDAAAEYAAFADPTNTFHALSGRHGLADRTRVMIEAIARHLDVRPGQRVLDIGCGDASLLARYPSSGVDAVGTVLTEPERARLAASPQLGGIAFHVASFESLEAVPGPFDWVIANGCLHFARTKAGAHRAFDAIVARLAPGGRIWAGELHAKDFRTRRRFGRIEAIRRVGALHGRRAALGFARHLWRRRRRACLIVEAPHQAWWHVPPQEMPAFAARHGLRVDGLWPCRAMTGDSFYSLQDRFSCLLSRIGPA